MVLIDTCLVYDYLTGDIKPDHLALFANQAMVSVISIWELLIKYNTGKLSLPTLELTDILIDNGFTLLSIYPIHAQAIAKLPNHHKDPFDRMLIAQAISENVKIATYDKLFLAYLPGTLLF
jgi:PIN domain nuclease of toxin-antitoxin system